MRSMISVSQQLGRAPHLLDAALAAAGPYLGRQERLRPGMHRGEEVTGHRLGPAIHRRAVDHPAAGGNSNCRTSVNGRRDAASAATSKVCQVPSPMTGMASPVRGTGRVVMVSLVMLPSLVRGCGAAARAPSPVARESPAPKSPRRKCAARRRRLCRSCGHTSQTIPPTACSRNGMADPRGTQAPRTSGLVARCGFRDCCAIAGAAPRRAQGRSRGALARL